MGNYLSYLSNSSYFTENNSNHNIDTYDKEIEQKMLEFFENLQKRNTSYIEERIEQQIEERIEQQIEERIEKALNNRYSQLNDVQQWKTKYSTLLSNYEALQKDYNNLLNTQSSRNLERPFNSVISLSALQQYIDDEILATSANSKFIPDALERKAYLAIYKTALETIQQFSNNTALTLLNHRISIYLEPIENK